METKIRVLWFSVTPSLYDEKSYGGWVASLERIIRRYGSHMELGIAFEHTDTCFKQFKDGVTYYPINKVKSKLGKIRLMLDYNYEWDLLKPCMLDIIEDFKPDIIQCFGTEWPFGLIGDFTKVPVVIHMQGFSTIYSLSCSMVYRNLDVYKYLHYNPFSIFRYKYRSLKNSKAEFRENKIMKINRFYMGRTEWDKNIVKYFNPHAKYYHCEEALRSEIINSPYSWKYQERKQMRIITISSASSLKGNELILRTAQLLKKFGFEFEWRVAGSKDSFLFSEKKIGINHVNLGIKLIGRIEASAVAKELAEADVYVHTAIIDNSPNSLCEAQYIGCPVLSTFVGGIPQLVEDGKTGLFYPYNEPYTLAFKLMNIFQNVKLLSYLSKNEILVSHNRHNDESIFLQLFNIYKDILK